VLVAACVFAALAALVHVYIFVLESLRWTEPATRRVFGTTEEAAALTRPLAYNQGFYNLFLAVGVALGLGLVATGDIASGRVLILFACGSMVAAGVVLYLHNPHFLRAAAVQVVPPLIAVAATLLLG
jgi:putative membrane protein